MKMVKNLKMLCLSTSSKTIGTNYLVFSILAGFLGGAMPFIIHLGKSLSKVDITSFLIPYTEDPFQNAFFAFFTQNFSLIHAFIMICFVALPALLGGFGNWGIPSMIKAENVAFPKLNRFSFLLLLLALLMFVLGISLSANGQNLGSVIFSSFFLLGVSFLCTAVNFFTTIAAMRGQHVKLTNMPIFVWSIFIVSFFIILTFPLLLAGSVMGYLGFLDGQHFSKIAHYKTEETLANTQILFWFLSHPETYILLLPAFGILSQITKSITSFSFKIERNIVIAMNISALLGFIFWAQNFFFLFENLQLNSYFIIALPILCFTLIFIAAHLFYALLKAKPEFNILLCWSFGALFMVLSGMLSGVFIYKKFLLTGQDPLTILVPLIVHFHYIVSLTLVFALFSGWYYWFPKVTGYCFNKTLSYTHFILFFLGVNFIFLPRYFAFAFMEKALLIGAIAVIFSFFLFVFSIYKAYCDKMGSKENLTEKTDKTLEWQKRNLNSPKNL